MVSKQHSGFLGEIQVRGFMITWVRAFVKGVQRKRVSRGIGITADFADGRA